MRMQWIAVLMLCCVTPLKVGSSDIKVDWVIRTMNVSAYCICSDCCGNFADGVTASGVDAVGFLVAAPCEYAFGTLMVIDGYAGGAVVVVEDRGGSIIDNRLDLLFPSHQAALVWGRRIIDVEILKVR